MRPEIEKSLAADPLAFLRYEGMRPGQEPELLPCALALAAIDRPGVSIGRYIHECEKMAARVAAVYAARPDPSDGGPLPMLDALRAVIAGELGYDGDSESYDRLDNANIMHVIDSRKGLPITLSILYIYAGRAQGWDVKGINFPGHFFARIDAAGQRVLFDPFAGGRVLEAHDLRAILKRTSGPAAELSATFLEPASTRDILIRLQNNLKFRLIAAEDYEAALRVVEVMRLIDPQEPRLLLDAGVLYARLEQTKAAITALEAYIEKAPRALDRHDAFLLLEELRARMN